MQENSNILITDKSSGGILRLVLNDLKHKNALSEIMINSLIDEINLASSDKSVKVIVIAAIGNVFCSGHDLKEITSERVNQDGGEKYFKELFTSCSNLMQLIINTPKPIIAEVNGVATAAGCQLVASCDLALASEDSRFATPGVNLGLFCSTPMVALSRNVSKKDAMAMLLTGDMISADKAKEIGLINDIYSTDDVTNQTMKLAQKIATKSSLTLATGKKAFYAQAEMNLSNAYEYTSKVMTDNLMRDDAKEGINAFIEKRDPDWQDN
jgi:enoyl-CoA hydratase/carnithine racemase